MNPLTLSETTNAAGGTYLFQGATPVPYTTPLGRDFIRRQEFARDVDELVSLTCQSYQVNAPQELAPRPDRFAQYLVRYAARRAAARAVRPPKLVVIYEPQEQASDASNRMHTLRAARQFAREHAWAFQLLDEGRIRTPALANITFLDRFRTLTYARAQTQAVVAGVRELGIASFDYVLARHFPGCLAAQGVSHLWHLVSVRALVCDITLPFTNRTELWVPHEA